MERSSSALVLPRIGLALLISALAGVLLAGLAFPVIGGLGLATKAGADDFLALPAALDTPAPATRSQVLAADGTVIARFYRVNRVDAPFASIPVPMRQAIVAIEDSRFYEHNGVDYKGTLRAAVTDLKSSRVAQGGSTLTQQYVKNALLEAATDKAGQEAAKEDSADRKLREARYALALEQKLSKDEILTRYLNIAYFGNGAYGIGTAANYYFNKPVEQLTLAESALLAGVVQNPAKYDVDSKDPQDQAALLARRNTVLGRMRDLGDITEAVRAQTAATPLPVVTPTKVGSDCGAPDVVAPFFCDVVRKEIEGGALGNVLGTTSAARQNRLFNGGLTIHTTIDLRIQDAAQKAVDGRVPYDDPSGLAAVSDVVEPGTGAIRAMAINRPYGEGPGQTQVNLATGGTFGYQPGSTFKAFFLAEAIREGIPLSTQINSPAEYSPKAFPYKDGNGRNIPVHNAGDSEAGVFDLRSGTAESVNTFFIQLAERTGLEKPLALAESMGVKEMSDKGLKPLPRVASTVLGSATVSPLAMAGAYATFAAHGVHCEPRAVVGIDGPDGKPLAVPAPDCKQVLDAGVADTVTSVLTGDVDGSNPHRTGSGASIGRPVAGKTGTTNDSKAAWFVGYTPQLANATWIGTPAAPTPMLRIRVKGSYYSQMFGGYIPAGIFHDTMLAASAPLEKKGFAPADPATVAGRNSEDTTAAGSVPDVTGRSYDDAVAILKAAGLTPTAGRTVSSRVRSGQVAYTSPRAGRSAPAGGRVYVYRSSGPAKTTTAPKTQAPVPPSADGQPAAAGVTPTG